MNQNTNVPMKDREMLEDALCSQKLLTDSYNLYADECATVALRDEMLSLLHEEHCIQADVFLEMQKRGGYPTPMAEEQKIQTVKQKFQSATAGSE